MISHYPSAQLAAPDAAEQICLAWRDLSAVMKPVKQQANAGKTLIPSEMNRKAISCVSSVVRWHLLRNGAHCAKIYHEREQEVALK